MKPIKKQILAAALVALIAILTMRFVLPIIQFRNGKIDLFGPAGNWIVPGIILTLVSFICVIVFGIRSLKRRKKGLNRSNGALIWSVAALVTGIEMFNLSTRYAIYPYGNVMVDTQTGEFYNKYGFKINTANSRWRFDVNDDLSFTSPYGITLNNGQLVFCENALGHVFTPDTSFYFSYVPYVYDEDGNKAGTLGRYEFFCKHVSGSGLDTKYRLYSNLNPQKRWRCSTVATEGSQLFSNVWHNMESRVTGNVGGIWELQDAVVIPIDDIELEDVDYDTALRRLQEMTATEGKQDGHQWVNLELPSGIRWATTNIGSYHPSRKGNRYAWAEVRTKSNYEWENLRYCVEDNWIFSKYVTNSEHGDVDDKTELEPKDDAATFNWGASWRTPTMEEFEELLFYCDHRWVRRDGMYGIEFKSWDNGLSIFLPAGWGEADTELYWTADLRSPRNNCAEAFSIQKNIALNPDLLVPRCMGLPVRPVFDPQN